MDTGPLAKMIRNEFIQTWREELSLSIRDVATRAQLAEVVVSEIEAGNRDPSIDELESIARTLGLKGDLLLDEDVPKSAGIDVLRVLFKSAEGLTPPPGTRLQMLDAARAALDLLELHDSLGISGPSLPTLRPLTQTKEALHKLGAGLAKEARSRLGLGKTPIPSMRDLVTRLGIPIIAANLGQFGPDAFSVFAPGGRLAFVINVDGKHENHLVRRFSLAHELGHGFSDKPNQGGSGFACLIDSQRALDIEIKANAFAIGLLVPSDVGKLRTELLKPEVFRQTMEKWGIHFSALRLFTKNVLGLTDDETARRAPRVETTAPLRLRDAEELEAERSTASIIPLPRRGELARLVLGEVAGERMTRGRARELLRVDAGVDLDALARSVGVA
jgi:Zn-dependent peptidase ImmA (M78 family)/transcriptional regulator with XRE-family HTH domain